VIWKLQPIPANRLTLEVTIYHLNGYMLLQSERAASEQENLTLERRE
jgi:hypothetical protein